MVALEDGLLPEHRAAPAADDQLGGRGRLHVLHLPDLHPRRRSDHLQPSYPASEFRAPPPRRRPRAGATAGRGACNGGPWS
uniref:Uncharacterized protein n=1 Tax=Arundo donax TaxID=35708 RepID=A0A0A9TZ33_ARUDO